MPINAAPSTRLVRVQQSPFATLLLGFLEFPLFPKLRHWVEDDFAYLNVVASCDNRVSKFMEKDKNKQEHNQNKRVNCIVINC